MQLLEKLYSSLTRGKVFALNLISSSMYEEAMYEEALLSLKRPALRGGRNLLCFTFNLTDNAP